MKGFGVKMEYTNIHRHNARYKQFFVAGKHGQVVAAVLSRAQLWKLYGWVGGNGGGKGKEN